jgi:hypothetical protein
VKFGARERYKPRQEKIVLTEEMIAESRERLRRDFEEREEERRRRRRKEALRKRMERKKDGTQ